MTHWDLFLLDILVALGLLLVLLILALPMYLWTAYRTRQKKRREALR